MAHCLSNVTLSQTSFSSSKSDFLNERFCHATYPIIHIDYKRLGHNKIKAMAPPDGRPHLDHLQRAEKPQPKRKLPQPAPIGLWDRFPTARTVQQMMETMDSLVEDPFAYSRGWSASPAAVENASAGGYSRGRTPWEIKEFESEYKMRFDMPGMTKEDVKVWVEEKMLVLRGEKEKKKKGENGSVGKEEDEGDWSAKSYGKYSCRIALPENVEFEKIKAEVRDGVLYITIPKAQVNAKVLDINVE